MHFSVTLFCISCIYCVFESEHVVLQYIDCSHRSKSHLILICFLVDIPDVAGIDRFIKVLENVTSTVLQDDTETETRLFAIVQLLEVEPWQLVWPEGAGDGKCMAFVDNWVLHDTPYNMYIKGHVNAQRVVVGATSMDSLDLTPIDKSGDFVPLKMVGLQKSSVSQDWCCSGY